MRVHLLAVDVPLEGAVADDAVARDAAGGAGEDGCSGQQEREEGLRRGKGMKKKSRVKFLMRNA